jgi:nucleoside 2-deoxyribosyltransferase
MNLYLAGPMRGYVDFNFPAFDAGAAALRERGFVVFNPADHDREVLTATGRTAEELTIRECMRADTAWICDNADGVALLDGWQKSTGALAEVALARAIGIPAFELAYWLDPAFVDRVAA